MRDDLLRIAAVGEHRGDAPPVRGPTGDLAAGDQRQLRLGQVVVLALVGVGEVHPGAHDLDDDLVGPGLGVGKVDDLEHLGATELLDLDGTHGAGV